MKIQKHSMGTNYIFHTMYQMLTMLTPLITTPYISRVLQAEGIGAYSYTYTIAQYFIILGNFGFSTYGQIEIARCRNDEKKRINTFWELFIMRTCVFTLSLIGYIFLIVFSSEYQILYIILSGYLIASYIDISWYYFGQDDFKSVSIRNIFVKIIGIVGIFVFVKTKEDLWRYVLILSASTLLGSIVMWPGIKGSIKSPILNELHFKRHIRPTLEYFIPNIATSIYTMLDKTMIGIFTEGDAQNGYYEQAHKIEQMVVQFLLSISIVAKSKMANLLAENKVEEAQSVIDTSVKNILLLSIPMCVGMIAVAEDLVLWFLGDKFASCVILVQLFAVLLIIIGLSNCASNMYLLPNNMQNKFTVGVYIGASINVVCNLILIPQCGALGATISSVVSEFIILVLFFRFSSEFYKIKRYKWEIIRYAFGSVMMLMAIMMVDVFSSITGLFELVLKIGVGVVVYFVVLLILKDKTLLKYKDAIYEKIKRNS